MTRRMSHPKPSRTHFALLSQQEAVQRIRVVQKLFNVVLSEWHPRVFFEDSEHCCAVNEHIPQVLWIFSDTNDDVGKGHVAFLSFLPFDFLTFFHFSTLFGIFNFLLLASF